MLAATLALAAGASLLAAFRFSGSPVGAGVLVFIGAWLVAIGCAMQLAAIVDRVPLARGWRMLAKLAAWALVALATGWAIYRAPGPELLTGLITVPPVVGLLGVGARGQERGAALGFLAVSLGLTALLIPAALERVG